MLHELEEDADERLDFAHYAGVFRRRQLVFLIAFFLVWLVVWSASWVLPTRYTWGSQIRVSISKPDDDLSGRLQVITNQVLSNASLLKIIDDVNLYAEDRGRLTPDELAERMRSDIKVEQVRGEDRQFTSVNIYYSAHNPDLARRAAGALTNLFVVEDETMRLRESEDRTNFLEDQLKIANQNLVEQEARVRLFKDQHPELGANVQVLAALRSELQNREDALNIARQRIMTSTAHDSKTDTRSSPPSKVVALEQELEKLAARRDELRLRYKDKYPEVRTITEEINEKSKVLAELKADPRNSPATAVTLTPQPDMAELEKRELEVSALRARINEYEKLTNQAPALEQQLSELTRGYDQSKAHYNDVLNNKIASEMETEQLRRHQGQLSRTVALTRLPLKPDFPNRMKLCSIGLGFGLVLGTLLVGGAEYLDDRLYDEEGLKKLVPVSTITKIPALATPEEKTRQRRNLWLTWTLTGFVFVVVLAGSAISFLKG